MRQSLLIVAISCLCFHVAEGQYQFIQGSSEPVTVDPAAAFLVRDIDADGHLDVTSGAGILFGNGDGTFGNLTPIGFLATMADIDSDGLEDVVYRNFNSIEYRRNVGGRQFSFPIQLAPTTSTTFSYALGDIDADGAPDLLAVTLNSSNEYFLELRLNDGTGVLGAPQCTQLPGLVRVILSVKNIDADPAIEVVMTSGDSFLVFEMMGGGFIQTDTVLATRFSFQGTLVTDLDDDGLDELIGISGNDDDIDPPTLWIASATPGGFAAAFSVMLPNITFQNAGSSVSNVATGEFDNDGLTDILFTTRKGTYIISAVGTAPFGSPEQIPNPLGFNDSRDNIRIGDFDEDGDLDYVARVPNFVTTYLNVTSPGTVAPLPGTGEDLLLATSTGLMSPTSGSGAFVKSATLGDLLTLRMDSPAASFTGQPLALLLQVLFTGTAPQGDLTFPSIRLDPQQVVVLVDGLNGPFGQVLLPPLGFNWTTAIPAGLDGLSLFFQGFTLGPVSANGLFAATDAYEIRVF